jgi:hypothetical protein
MIQIKISPPGIESPNINPRSVVSPFGSGPGGLGPTFRVKYAVS